MTSLLCKLIFFSLLEYFSHAFLFHSHQRLSSIRVGKMISMAASTNGSPSASLPVKSVIFDIDGTLADSFQLGFSASQRVLVDAGYPTITAEEYHAFCIYPTPERLARHAMIEPVHGEEFWAVGKALGAEFDRLYIGLVDTATAGFYPGVGPLLIKLRDVHGVQVGALTNAAVAYGEAVLRANGVRDLFGTVHGADDVPAPKPHPDGLLLCCSDLDLKPEECVYVGDAPSDGKAARATGGMRALGVSYGSHPKTNLIAVFDKVVDSVAELDKALDALLEASPATVPSL